ncbi:hypothetical protein [Hydrogenophaga sp.]|nr:hypothetical protein [Hydrogenophaga sp.]
MAIAVEWPLLKAQRSAASQDDEWQVPAAAVIGLKTWPTAVSLKLGYLD